MQRPGKTTFLRQLLDARWRVHLPMQSVFVSFSGALETVVAIELERRRSEVGYVKTGAGFKEDFLASGPTGGEEQIQVCADPSDPETKVRQHPRATNALLVLTRDQVFSEQTGIGVRPVSEWLLSAGNWGRGLVCRTTSAGRAWAGTRDYAMATVRPVTRTGRGPIDPESSSGLRRARPSDGREGARRDERRPIRDRGNARGRGPGSGSP